MPRSHWICKIHRGNAGEPAAERATGPGAKEVHGQRDSFEVLQDTAGDDRAGERR